MAEQVPAAQGVPEHQDRGLFGLFGKKKEEEGRHDDQIMPPAATHIQTQAAHPCASNAPHTAAIHTQNQAAHPYASNLPHTAATHTQTQAAQPYASNPPHTVAVDQQYGQVYGHGHGGQSTAGEPEKQQHTGVMGKLHRTNSSSSSSSSDEEKGGKKKEGGRKKKGIKDKIKEKLPGKQHTSDPYGGQHTSDQYGREGEKKEGLVDKIKDKLPGHHNKE
jgi:hypothetical protein